MPCTYALAFDLLAWAANGTEVVAGMGDYALYLSNMERQKVSGRSLALDSLDTGPYCMVATPAGARPSRLAGCRAGSPL